MLVGQKEIYLPTYLPTEYLSIHELESLNVQPLPSSDFKK